MFGTKFENKSNIDKEIYPFDKDGFISQSRAKSGETIYLRMELITETNVAHIRQYLEYASFMGTGLSTLPSYIQPTESGSYVFTPKSKYNCWDNFQDNFRDGDFSLDYYKKAFGCTDDELQQLINFMGKNGFHKNNKNRSNFHETRGGADHLYCYPVIGRYFVYASKNPNFRIENTQVLKEKRKLTLQEFSQQYKDILICVGYSLDASHMRGIFRNPIRAIEKNTYNGLALPLVSFIGAVAKRFLNQSTLNVRPILRMPGILINALEDDDFSIHGISNERARTEIKENKLNCFQSRMFTIQTHALCRLFIKLQRSDSEIQKTLIAEEKQNLSEKNLAKDSRENTLSPAATAKEVVVMDGATLPFFLDCGDNEARNDAPQLIIRDPIQSGKTEALTKPKSHPIQASKEGFFSCRNRENITAFSLVAVIGCTATIVLRRIVTSQ